MEEKCISVRYDRHTDSIGSLCLDKNSYNREEEHESMIGTKYKANWEETKKKFTNYWKHQNTGRPLMCVIARKPEIEKYADGQPAQGGYLGQICQGNYYNLPEELMWKKATVLFVGTSCITFSR